MEDGIHFCCYECARIECSYFWRMCIEFIMLFFWIFFAIHMKNFVPYLLWGSNIFFHLSLSHIPSCSTARLLLNWHFYPIFQLNEIEKIIHWILRRNEWNLKAKHLQPFEIESSIGNHIEINKLIRGTRKSRLMRIFTSSTSCASMSKKIFFAEYFISLYTAVVKTSHIEKKSFLSFK